MTEDLIWLRTFQGNIASAIYFHEIGHMLSYRLADRDETAFCEKLSDITRHFPRSYLEDLMEFYAWCLGTCMAAHIYGLCSKKRHFPARQGLRDGRHHRIGARPSGKDLLQIFRGVPSGSGIENQLVCGAKTIYGCRPRYGKVVHD